MIDIPDCIGDEIMDAAFEFECQELRAKQNEIENLKKNAADDLSSFAKKILIIFAILVILLTVFMFIPAVSDLPIGFKLAFYALLLAAFFSSIALYSYLSDKNVNEEIHTVETACERRIQKKYLAAFKGIDVRSFLEIPDGVYFDKNNLPFDISTKYRPFGSFTFYLSMSGKCFHTVEGCSSAFYPVHSFKVINRYKPCTRCFDAKKSVIPDWYQRAKKFAAICERYSLNFDLPRKEDSV